MSTIEFDETLELWFSFHDNAGLQITNQDYRNISSDENQICFEYLMQLAERYVEWTCGRIPDGFNDEKLEQKIFFLPRIMKEKGLSILQMAEGFKYIYEQHLRIFSIGIMCHFALFKNPDRILIKDLSKGKNGYASYLNADHFIRHWISSQSAFFGRLSYESRSDRVKGMPRKLFQSLFKNYIGDFVKRGWYKSGIFGVNKVKSEYELLFYSGCHLAAMLDIELSGSFNREGILNTLENEQILMEKFYKGETNDDGIIELTKISQYSNMLTKIQHSFVFDDITIIPTSLYSHITALDVLEKGENILPELWSDTFKHLLNNWEDSSKYENIFPYLFHVAFFQEWPRVSR